MVNFAFGDYRANLWLQQLQDQLSGTTSNTQVSVAALPVLQFVPLKRALESGLTTAFQVLSDSTANDTTDWAYRFAQALGAKYPNYTVQSRLWNDTTQDFDPHTTIQTGAGGEQYLNMVAGNYSRRLINAAAPHLTGVIDVRLDIQAADWTPANTFGSTILVGEGGGTGDWGWYFSITPAGILQFVGSSNGTSLDYIMNATVATGITDGTRSRIRAVFTPNDGAGNRTCAFYKSTDGVTWTQIGSTVTTAGAATLADRIATGSSYRLCAAGAATNQTAFQIYSVDIRNGNGGVGIVPKLPSLWGVYGGGVTSHPIVGAPVLTLVNASKPGANIAYLGDATRLPRMTPNYGQSLVFLSDSHNETNYSGIAWLKTFTAWQSQVSNLLYGVPQVVLTQNPEIGGDYLTMHAQRRIGLLGLPNVIDTYKAFLDSGSTWSSKLMMDNIHPNATGSDLWRDTLMAHFNAS